MSGERVGASATDEARADEESFLAGTNHYPIVALFLALGWRGWVFGSGLRRHEVDKSRVGFFFRKKFFCFLSFLFF